MTRLLPRQRLHLPEAGLDLFAQEETDPVTARNPSEHAERFTDMLLEFHGERARRVEEYQRLVDRIDDVLEGRAGEFLTGSAALK